MQLKLLGIFLLSLTLISLVDMTPDVFGSSDHKISAPSGISTLNFTISAHTQGSTIQTFNYRSLYIENIKLTSQTKAQITIGCVGIILLLIIFKKCWSNRCKGDQNKTEQCEDQTDNIIRTITPDEIEIDRDEIPVDKINFDIDLIKTKYLMSTCSSTKASPDDLCIKDTLDRSC